MITLRVDVATGHYRVPGQVPTQASTYPIAPPSTIQGFLESLVGCESGTFKGKIAYGWLQRPLGQGRMLRKAHVWSSAGLPSAATGRPDRHGEVTRIIHVPVFFQMSYAIQVDGPWEARIRLALSGDVDRYGVLSLGESEDMVTWCVEYIDSTEKVDWVVPAAGPLVLPVKTGRGWDNMSPTLRSFKYQKRETSARSQDWALVV